MTNPDNTIASPPKKKGCGCVAKGCLILVILLLIIVGLLGCDWQKAVNWARTETSSTPVELPAENATQAEYDALVKKLDDYKSAEPGSGKTLQITAHDLNVLVALSPEWQTVRGKIHFTIDDDQIGLACSVPLNRVPMFKDQYFNGTAYFKLSIDDKVEHLDIQKIKLKAGDLSNDDLKKASGLIQK